MVSLIVVTGWLAAGLGPTLFAVYALSRRVLSAVAAVVPGPLGVALVRAIAAARIHRERDACLWAGTLLALGATVAVVGVGVAFPAFWARLLLSDARYGSEFLAILVLVTANTVYQVVFAQLRGTSEIRRANLWQLWALAVGPLLAVGLLARHGPVSKILLLLAAVMAPTVVPLLVGLVRAARTGLGRGEVLRLMQRLVRYSAPRVPGTAALAGLLSLGPLLAPYFGHLREAGYLVAAQSVLRVAEVGSAGFGLVVLPRVSGLQGRDREPFLRDRVEDLVALVLHLGVFAACQLAIWAPEIVEAWLGAGYLEAVPVVRVFLVALVPYLGYTLLRSVIDGIEERPVNPHNLYIALACTAVLSVGLGLAGLGAFGLAVAAAVGFGLVGLLTVRYLWRRLRCGGTQIYAGSAVALNLAAAAVALLVRSALQGRLKPAMLLLAATGLSGLLLLGYLLALRRLQVRWVIEVEARLLPRGGSR